MDKLVIVLGFGRSGTTWISDMISKMYGKLILFEPFHPSVTELSQGIAYSTVDKGTRSVLIDQLLTRVMGKRHKKLWLLRNHLPARLEQISDTFVEKLWDECDILGFKEIRANFMIEWLATSFLAKIVFIIRHPCAVAASIKNRDNFWEFGWPGTYHLFLERTIFNEKYNHHPIAERRELIKGLDTDIEKYAAMWAITHAIVLPKLKQQRIPLFFYEKFYEDPFDSARTLAAYLGNADINIHPAHIFTPSMTTLKTFHGISGMETQITEKGPAMFWDGSLSEQEVKKILFIVGEFGIDLYDTVGCRPQHTSSNKACVPGLSSTRKSHSLSVKAATR